MPKPLPKVAVLDTETTGVIPGKHGLIQVAGAILINNVTEEEFNFKCSPFPDDVIDPEALEIQGRTEEEVRRWPDPAATYRELLSVLGRHVDKFNKKDKLGFVAFNAGFDNSHMRAWFKKCDPEQGKYFGSWFWNPPMDIMSAAALLFGDARLKLENFKQGTVCEYLGIEAEGELHDADVDVRLATAVYRRLTDKWFEKWDK